MKVHVHFVTEHFPPERGGLEVWSAWFCSLISETAGFGVTVYIVGSAWRADPAREPAGYEIHPLSSEIDILTEPVRSSSWAQSRKESEIQRAQFLCLANAIGRRKKVLGNSRHVVMSNFALGVGFLAGNVAEHLELPHVVRLAGTDFSRGMRAHSERARLLGVLAGAYRVVALNSEQERLLKRVDATLPIHRIPCSVDLPAEIERHGPRPDGLTIFADCGYSHKKGTHLMLSAFEQAIAAGCDARLAICGPDEPGQEPYWSTLREETVKRIGRRIDLIGYLEPAEIEKFLAGAGLYCSATIGEGSSLARIRALCLGVPMLTTACGEMTDLDPLPRHVTLAPPGDGRAFAEAMSRVITTLRSSSITADRAELAQCRSYFSREREAAGWISLLRAT